MADKSVPALLLTLGGAPVSWHVVVGVGYVHPSIPSPVGGAGELSVAAAEKAAGDAGSPVKLVYVTGRQAEAARDELARLRGLSRSAVRVAVQQGDRRLPHVAAERAALGETEESGG